MNKGTKIAIGVGVGILILGITAYIFRDKLKKLAKENLGGFKWFDESLQWYRGSKNREIVENLHPKFKDRAKEFLSRIEKETPYYPILTSGYRTWEKQAELKKENDKNASAGSSTHNYGFAFDLNLARKSDNQIVYKKETSKNDWLKTNVPKISNEMGFTWGGDFPNYHDPVHFQDNLIFDLEKFKKMYLAGNKDVNGFVTIT